MTKDDTAPRKYASPPCMAGDIAPDLSGTAAMDAEEMAARRRAARARLLSERAAMGPKARATVDRAIARHLDQVLKERFNSAKGMILAGFWPIRGEVDLMGWLARQSAAGVQIALPVVAAKDAPLIFRPWSPDAEMRPGPWNIPEPATDAQIMPQIVLAPLVGWDAARFRMGYGGGFYDRTFAALRPCPYGIGIGHEAGRLPSISPQPHDIALDLVITEAGAV
ncbi:MAG: 5-formyltetrahydrofolate cyclo-ligase [Paracoccus sp. (in: a-proteobacteria)]